MTEAHPAEPIEVPEAVGVLDDSEARQAAFHDLRMVGVSRHDISLLGGVEAMRKKLGDRFWTSKEMGEDPEAPRAACVPEEAIGELERAIAGGFFFLGSAIAMTALLTPASTLAASIATLLARRAGAHHKDCYASRVANGGILLWARVTDQEKDDLAVRIPKARSGRDVHVHHGRK